MEKYALGLYFTLLACPISTASENKERKKFKFIYCVQSKFMLLSLYIGLFPSYRLYNTSSP